MRRCDHSISAARLRVDWREVSEERGTAAALTAAEAVAGPSQLLGRLRAVQGADLGPRDRSHRSVLHTAHQRKVRNRTVCVSPVTVVGVP